MCLAIFLNFCKFLKVFNFFEEKIRSILAVRHSMDPLNYQSINNFEIFFSVTRSFNMTWWLGQLLEAFRNLHYESITIYWRQTSSNTDQKINPKSKTTSHFAFVCLEFQQDSRLQSQALMVICWLDIFYERTLGITNTFKILDNLKRNENK